MAEDTAIYELTKVLDKKLTAIIERLDIISSSIDDVVKTIDNKPM